ncbi:AAA family ATPase [Amycolatopsis sp. NPDC051061]|uniref:AAA family ATPase n=1 Tax=Amycolatopsis sp. NPDC051061 TaxID=3155042 RepID=UPI003445CAFB
MPIGGPTQLALEAALGVPAAAEVLRWAELNGMAIEVDRHQYGHSSARVAAVYLQSSDGKPEQRLIVKAFEAKSARESEVRRHRAALQDAPDFAERHLVRLPWHAISYGTDGVVMFQHVAAGGLEPHGPLRELLDTPASAVAVGEICRSLLTEWNATGTKAGVRSLAQLLDWHLGARIRPGGKIWSWAEPVPQLLRTPAAWLEVDGEVLPNPLAFGLSARLGASPSLRIQTGKGHGDLHATNVLCSSPQPDRPFEFRLIDLATYAADVPLAWDQASLLMAVIRRSLEVVTDRESRRRLLRHVTGEEAAADLPAEVADAIAAIKTAGEQWAEPAGQLTEWRRQLQAASVSSALVLTGRSSLAPADRWWFFLLAARQLAVLLGTPEADPPGPAFVFDDATIAQLAVSSASADVLPEPVTLRNETPPTLVKPRQAWRQRTAHREQVAALRRAASDDEFARLASAYLFVTFGGFGGEVEVTADDAVAGLFLVDSTHPAGGRLRIAIQLMRLPAGDDWYTSHGKESVGRIREFQLSGLVADQYLFIHNQDSRDESYNRAVLAALDPLVSLGDVGWAGMWDRYGLVSHLWQGVYERCKVVVDDYTAGAAEAVSGLVGDDPVTEVPFRRYVAVFAPTGFESVGEQSDRLADPVPDLVAEDKGIHLVVGEFGFGKTTVMVRAARVPGRRVILLPAARLGTHVTSLHDILSAILTEFEEHLNGYEESLRELWRKIAPRILDVMLTESDEGVRLVVDGLDEAPMTQRRSGLLELLRSLRKLGVPILVSARSEFWNARLGEVGMAMSERGENPIRQYITTTEMRPWTADCMIHLIDRSLRADGPDDHLAELRVLVEEERFEELYGDIPRRPLFLGMLIEDVAPGRPAVTIEARALRQLDRPEDRP